ncbi:HEAT repeat domain-containing protein [Parathalassolituus penaei]|uniref:HEAT repeat domain-containing protein n=1 Tax=Parathalassolituus penaei TaxID=2997323 RepID=A0A9X3ITU7_9GAMM|nr:HEAT repeat domain-containing protein [Parathalassolituus penaei]MCY0965528.1 HEAT repeat domain-containing protein [Parathalassolituus penaei]
MALLQKSGQPRPAPDDPTGRILDVEALERCLHDPSADIRRRAAADLASCQQATQWLLTQLQQETIPSVRQVIITSLTRINTTEAVQGLATCLRAEDARLRNDAIEAMKQMPDAMAPVIEELLQDQDPDIRIFAVNILESLCHEQVENWLLDVMDNDASINVVCAALDIIGEVGTEIALPVLERTARRFNDAYVGFACDLAIRRIADSRPAS